MASFGATEQFLEESGIEVNIRGQRSSARFILNPQVQGGCISGITVDEFD